MTGFSISNVVLNTMRIKIGMIFILGTVTSPSVFADADGGKQEQIVVASVDVNDSHDANSNADEKLTNLASSFDSSAKLAQVFADAIQITDVETLAKTIGPDPEKLQKWVRSNTDMVPYKGLLRGAEGVLIDRTGNSLDRSLLLGALLDANGFEVRLANGQMQEATAAALLERLEIKSYLDAELIKKLTLKENEVIAANFSPEQREEIDEKAEELSRAGSAIRAELLDRTRKQYAALEKKLAHNADSVAKAARQKMLAATMDHWWVKMKRGEEWVDLDLLNAKDGSVPLGVVKKTYRLRSIPRSFFHRVEIKVLIGIRDGKGITQKPVLNKVYKTADLLGKSIVFNQGPANWPRDGLSREVAGSFYELINAADAWKPALMVGKHTVKGKAFDGRGEFVEAGGDALGGPPNASNKKLTGGLLDSIGGGSARSKEDEKAGNAPDGNGQQLLVSERIQYRIIVPGEKEQVRERVLFDLEADSSFRGLEDLSASQRKQRNYGAVAEIELFIAGFEPNPLYADKYQTLATARFLEAFSAAVKKKSIKAGGAIRTPSPLVVFAALRKDFRPNQDSVFLNQTNIFGYVKRFLSDHGRIGYVEGFDVVANEVGSLQVDVDEEINDQLYQGVLDTNLEAYLLSIISGKKKAGEEAGAYSFSGNTSNFMGYDPDDEEWVSIENSTDWFTLNANRGGIQRIQSELTSGCQVIASSSGHALHDSLPYWRFNPDTGSLLGIDRLGAGGSQFIEYMVPIYRVALPLVTGAKAFHDCMGGSLAGGEPMEKNSDGVTLMCAACGGAAVVLGHIGLIKNFSKFGLGKKAAAAMGFGLGASGFCGELGDFSRRWK